MAFGCILASRIHYCNTPTASGFPEAVDTRVHDIRARFLRVCMCVNVLTDDFL